MSHHFREMREGDYLAVKGPKVRFLREFVSEYSLFPVADDFRLSSDGSS